MPTKREIMEGIEATSSKVVATNTVEYIKPDGTRVIRLHHTDILEFPKRGGVVFNSGGYKTKVTKERMNEFQSETFIHQAKGLWYLSFPTDKTPYNDPFFDGIKVKSGKVVKPRKLAHAKEEFLLKQIQKYCKRLKELPELPEPNGGDCWYCSFQGEDHKTMGELSGSDHLTSHLKEKYIPGSLIWNALLETGYQEEHLPLIWGRRDIVVRAVRKYFKAQLGLVH